MARRFACYKQQALTAFLFFLFFLYLFSPKFVLGYSEDETGTSIQVAEKAICSAFEAVLEAEGAGGNVSGFIARLNQASDLLVKAKSMVRNGGSDSDAVELASRAAEIADSVKYEALDLQSSVSSYHEFILKIYVFELSVGVAIFLVFMFLLWRWFKGYYMRRILSLKPEVAEDVKA